jgi:hypothetical protein
LRNATDGEITVAATGGTGTKTYSKDNEQLSRQMYSSGLAAGTPQIKVDATHRVSGRTALAQPYYRC